MGHTRRIVEIDLAMTMAMAMTMTMITRITRNRTRDKNKAKDMMASTIETGAGDTMGNDTTAMTMAMTATGVGTSMSISAVITDSVDMLAIIRIAPSTMTNRSSQAVTARDTVVWEQEKVGLLLGNRSIITIEVLPMTTMGMMMNMMTITVVATAAADVVVEVPAGRDGAPQ
jgi:hypothetical protein